MKHYRLSELLSFGQSSSPTRINRSKRRQLRRQAHPLSRCFSVEFARFVEELEDRTLLSTITVTSTADNLDVDEQVTLREAIAAANTDTSVDGSTAGSGADVIIFDASLAGETITLGGTELVLSDDVTISASSIMGLEIDANYLSRLFSVETGVTATLESLALVNGQTTGAGGAVLNAGTLSVIDCTVADSSAGESGGGIGNTGILAVTDTVISGNSATVNGGGLESTGGAVTIISSSVVGNWAGNNGGGIEVFDGTLSITNSTISNNLANTDGGGIWRNNTTWINHATITDNVADTGDDGEGVGGGLYGPGGGAYLPIVHNSIISGNHEMTSGSLVDDDVNDAFHTSSSCNLIGVGGDLTDGVDGNQVGVVDPRLAPLSWVYGGSTPTCALLADSPAIDAADPASTATEDQRGVPRPINGGTSETNDIGAFEYLGTIIVDENSDVVDNDYSAGHVSLREAILASNYNPGTQTIIFDESLSGQTITLDGAFFGLIDDVTITGLGAVQLTINGNAASRIFYVDEGVTASISALTLTNGHTAESGGAIYNAGTLTIADATISGNGADGDGGAILNTGVLTVTGSTISGNAAEGDLTDTGFGGGISNEGTLFVTGSTIAGNTAADSGAGIATLSGPATVLNSTLSGNAAAESGGGIDCDYGTLTVTNTTIVGNSATSGYGGGIANTSGDATVTNSTVAGNTAFGGGGISNSSTFHLTNSTISGNNGSSGGGIANYTGGTLTVTNATISGNTGSMDGGGIYAANGEITLQHATITDNETTLPDHTGGGLTISSATVTSYNTIVCGNRYHPAAIGPDDAYDIDGTLEEGSSYNIIGVGGGLTNGVDGNQVGVTDPGLAPLDYYGGLTQTHALYVDSTAIDAADPSSPLTEDQRGVPRPLNGGISETADIGAFEYLTAILVDENSDVVDFDYSTGHVSLREAVEASNTNPGLQAIVFNESLTNQTITLDGHELELRDDVAITGLGEDHLTIDGNSRSRIFYVSSDVTASIASMTITNGLAEDRSDSFLDFYGGGILNTGELSLFDMTITGNAADMDGGGIENYFAILTLTNCTISGNWANGIDDYSGYGGGIDNTDASLTVNGSVISDNFALRAGGGIANWYESDATITTSTISGNSSDGDGGGVYSEGSLTVDGSTFSGNFVDSGYGGAIAYYAGPTTTMTLSNSTISGNSAAESGGGITALGMGTGEVLLDHTTITNNTANTDHDDSGFGGGLDVSGITVISRNSIIVGNYGKSEGAFPGDIDDDIDGLLDETSSYNLIGVGGGLTNGANGNQVGVTDAMLEPLDWYGGPTQTHALIFGSPAIDAADPGSELTEDQRGAARPFDAGGGAISDIGAFEYRTVVITASIGHLTLGRSGTHWTLTDDDTSDVVNVIYDEFSSLTIDGTEGADRLTIDFSGDDPMPAMGIWFNGGDPTSGAGDTLVLTGGTFDTISYDFENASDGTITLDSSTITFTGLEPITDNLSATDRVFNFGDTADTITLGDDGVPSDSISRISSTSSSETVDFSQPTSSLTINAGGGDDSLVVVNVDINNGATVNINGEAGTDSTVVYGSTGDDTASLTGTSLTLNRSDFTINGSGFEMYDVRGNGGYDEATLNDSAGADTFVASPTTARMVGTGFANWVRDFDKVTGFSNNGGSDTAYLHDSAGDDTYVASPTAARLTGTGFYNVANGFDVVRGYALNGGTDEAHLHDSAGDDTFIASTTLTRLIGSGFSNWAQSFEKVTAYALNGGTDTGELYDSPGDDDYISSATVGRVIGPGFANWVRNFEKVYVRSLNGGTDEAYLYDSAGDDTYIASATVGRMTGTGFYNAALYFDRVNAYRVNGGADEAQLYDSPGDDTFIASATVARLINSSSSYWAYYFPEVYARAINGGNDVADLYDSAGVDTFTVSPFTGRMEGTGFYNWVSGFDEIRGFSINGGNDNANLHDSSGNDTFVASPTTARMEGTGFINRATGFRYLNGFALNGGTDTAYLHDSAGDDFFTSSPGVSRMYGVGFSNFARNFEAVNAFALQGGNDLATYSEIQSGDSVTGSGDEFTLGRSRELDKANSFDTVRVEAGDGQTPTDNTGTINYVFEKIGSWL